MTFKSSPELTNPAQQKLFQIFFYVELLCRTQNRDSYIFTRISNGVRLKRATCIFYNITVDLERLMLYYYRRTTFSIIYNDNLFAYILYIIVFCKRFSAILSLLSFSIINVPRETLNLKRYARSIVLLRPLRQILNSA